MKRPVVRPSTTRIMPAVHRLSMKASRAVGHTPRILHSSTNFALATCGITSPTYRTVTALNQRPLRASPDLNLDNTYTSALPYFELDNPAGATTSIGYALGNNTHCNCPLDQLERQYQFVDNVSKIRGNHNFKFGADVRYALNLRVPSDNHRAGQLFFNNSYTGDVTAVGGNPYWR